MHKTIESSEITVVVQGAVLPETKECLESIRKHLPGSKIILSTWAGSDLSDFDADEKILNIDPGAFTYEIEGRKRTNNINRQIVSTLNGLKKVKTKYALKIRTDFKILKSTFLDYFDAFPKYPNDKSWKIFKHKVINYCDLPENCMKIPFFVTDFAFFGLTEDLLFLFDIPLESEEWGMWFKDKKPSNPDLFNYWHADLARFAPEEYIIFSALSKIQKDIFSVVPDWTYSEKEQFEKGNLFVISNFITLDHRQFPIDAVGKEYLKALKKRKTFLRFLKNYITFCDPYYRLPFKYFIEQDHIIKYFEKLRKESSYFLNPLVVTAKWIKAFFRLSVLSFSISFKFIFRFLQWVLKRN